MKSTLTSIILKISGLIASLAMVVAVGNVNSTCLFVSYQPDIPDELK